MFYGENMKKTFKNLFKKFIDDKGQGLVEYALIIFLVALVVIGAVLIFGENLTSIYSKTGNSLSEAIS